MLSLTQDDRDVQSDTDPLALCRCVVLPRTDTLLQAVERVRDCYLARTGCELSWPMAIHVLDQLRAGRPTPAEPSIPAHLFGIAHWLQCYSYSPEFVRQIIRFIERNGTVKNCAWVDGEDVAYLEPMLAAIDKAHGTEARP